MNLRRTTGYRIKKAVALALMTTLLFFVLDGNIHPNKASHNAYAQTSTPTCQKLPIATVTARGNSFSAGNVLDNNLNTAWIGRGMGAWIQADLGSNMNICDVNIAWYLGNMVKFNFIISVSSDGNTFTNVFTGKSSGTTLSFEKYTVSGGTTGRYVRITVNGNNFNNFAGITELSIDGYSNIPTPKPTANNENVQTNSGAPVQITLTGTDPIPGDQLTFTVVTPPQHGTLTPGTVSSIVFYTPNTGFSGTDSFTYKATDGQGVDSNVATVTITLNAPPPPSPPTANNENIQTTCCNPVQITLTGTDPIAGDVLTFAVVTQPQHGTLTSGTVSSIVNYTPNTGFSGTDSFTYKATDGQGVSSNVATVTITVNAAGSVCTTGWYITGYNVDSQADYPATPTTTITVGAGGPAAPGSYTFPTQFLSDVSINGAGYTIYGWYLYTYNSGTTWGSEVAPYDATGGVPKVGETIAVDTTVIPYYTKVTIPTLPAPWNSYTYTAEDTGGGIVGKHIDVFTGIGNAARAQANAITGTGNTVCK
jgi:3D (Asp-Asp-Asp) domain-containing protein